MLIPYVSFHSWRLLNTDTKHFTWHANKKFVRLDYWLISEHLANVVKECGIKPGLHSDHSLITLTINIDNTPQRGRGFWKLNSSLMYDRQYVELVKSTINTYNEQYNYLPDKGLKWELIKMEIRTATVRFAGKNVNNKQHFIPP